MRMRRTWGLVVAAAVAVLGMFVLVGCGKVPAGGSASGKKTVLCTTFPQYDWARQILGDANGNIELELLVKKGVDIHSYQPTVADVAKVGACDLFVYVGGESDAWVADALKNATNPNIKTIDLLEELGTGAREEEFVEGMQTRLRDEHGHDKHDHDEHDHDEHDEHGHDDAPEYDEHVWLSLKNADRYAGVLADALAELDPGNAETFRANAEAYRAKLAELDAKYQAAVDAAPKKTLLFADRFPFLYLADDYGIAYYAAFQGCSAETEASFETVVFLANKLDELGLGTVLVIDGSNQQLAKTVIQTTKDKNQKIGILDSLQSVSEDDIAKGRTYLGAMEQNLEVLRQAMA